MFDSPSHAHATDGSAGSCRFGGRGLIGPTAGSRPQVHHRLLDSTAEPDDQQPTSLGAPSATAPLDGLDKSRSVGSSPVKMESCLFSFPIPTPKTWTIMVEPITSQASTLQLHHWRTLPGTRHPGVQSSDRATLPLEEGPSQSSKEARCASMASPKRARRNRIYLNGTCIDKGTGAKGEEQSGRFAKGRHEEHGRTFTFINDKRMASPKDGPTCPAMAHVPVSPLLSSPPLPPSLPNTGGPVRIGTMDCDKPRRGRRLHKKFLTFHQLEFDNETLKPYDRSVFVSGHEARPARRAFDTATVACGDGQGKGGGRQSLLEAAEMLLELQMHPSSETVNAFEVPLSLSSTSSS